jgi:alpha-L-rhamnosidase
MVYYWRVEPTFRHTTTNTTTFSQPATFSMAPAIYSGKFIGLASSSNPFNQSSCPWLRKEITLPALVADEDVLLCYVGSMGYHELWINGRKANEDVLSPQVTDLAKRIPVRAYVTTARAFIGVGAGYLCWLRRRKSRSTA